MVQNPGWHALSSISWFRFDYLTIAWEAVKLLAPNGQRESPFFPDLSCFLLGFSRVPQISENLK